ncbi:MAG: hypothetical protein HXX10_02670 [Rhodoplanes sp.]|uniref:hypothetical protein n=1 Tax=Rhodoplanes sp. TaxID=1968906 RepID=UPI0017B6DF6D|nr:hypothetical protein [Rhodoplanes sp.]NVO12918.1 hypothetical protein [Rhodoplanes sp.]
MLRLVAGTFVLVGSTTVALAQLTTTPGPGGIPIAPGAPVQGYTPGGVGVGGTTIAPGAAARGVPMYREAPGGVPVLVTPEPGADGPGSGRRRAAPAGASAAVPDCSTRSCLPDSLRLTIDSDETAPDRAAPSDKPIGSLQALAAALRTCWVPPPGDQRRAGMQMSVRFGMSRAGALMGAPLVTYATPGVNADTRRVYRDAITASLDRCTPLRLSEGFAVAVAGRPLNVRYVDDRKAKTGAP